MVRENAGPRQCPKCGSCHCAGRRRLRVPLFAQRLQRGVADRETQIVHAAVAVGAVHQYLLHTLLEYGLHGLLEMQLQGLRDRRLRLLRGLLRGLMTSLLHLLNLLLILLHLLCMLRGLLRGLLLHLLHGQLHGLLHNTTCATAGQIRERRC